MKPAVFELWQPRTLPEALALMSRHAGASRPLAGGQTLVPVMNLRLATPGHLIDLNGVVGLSGIRREGNELVIGAMTRQAALLAEPLVREHVPLLASAVPFIGHVQTRSRGTVGGSLAHADPSAELPLVMVTLDATMELASERGRRRVPSREFFRHAMVTALGEDELITAVRIPISPASARCAFRELSRRHGDFALVAVAAQRDVRLTLAVGGLDEKPHVFDALAARVASSPYDAQQVAAWTAEAIEVTPALNDSHASAAYRRRLAGVLLREVIAELVA